MAGAYSSAYSSAYDIGAAPPAAKYWVWARQNGRVIGGGLQSMYPRNAASPEPIAIGPVVQISDGAVQTSGCTVRIKPIGVAEGDGAGTTAYSTDGIVLYTPTQAETNYTSFILIAKKTGCIPASVTVVPTASATPGVAVVPDTQKVDVNTIKTQSVTCGAGVTIRADVGAAAAPGAANGMLIGGSNAATTFATLTSTGAFTCGSTVLGNTTMGTLTQTGAVSWGATTFASVAITGAFSVGTTTTLTGAVTLSGPLGTGAVTFASLAVTGAASVGTTTTLTGAVSLGSTLAITGAVTAPSITLSGAFQAATIVSTGTTTLNALTVTNAMTWGSWTIGGIASYPIVLRHYAAGDTVTYGTCDSGGTVNSVICSAIDPSIGTDSLKGKVITFRSGTTTAALRNQSKTISANTSGATPTISLVEALTTAPVSGDTFTVT